MKLSDAVSQPDVVAARQLLNTLSGDEWTHQWLVVKDMISNYRHNYGIDSAGQPFSYDTEPLPLLNPSVTA